MNYRDLCNTISEGKLGHLELQLLQSIFVSRLLEFFLMMRRFKIKGSAFDQLWTSHRDNKILS